MFSYSHTVQYYETDKMGVTHHSNYIRFMEEARIAFMQSIGWSYDKMESMEIISPVVNVSCSYKKPSTFADIININTEVKELSRLKLTMAYTMTVGDTVVCTAESVHCFVSKSGRPINIQKEYPDFYQVVCDASR
ncbi:MAG: thioesterase family protein [Candidatus Fimisoma sp.]|nr:thioesterase family protein [Bacillota bacterium]MDY4748633.1 thioesterase family protein [Candidatus Fimisoma sp.]